ncbi:MAG TPA: PAS domain S-box protein [Polyangiaceae bacterium]|nr:PAS domain S-box protein [Polyangiaceae bacterium]
MSYGGSSFIEGEQFESVARFVCTLLGPAPLGVMVLDGGGNCVAANATLGTISRQTLDGDRVAQADVHFATAELASAFARALRGEIAMVETDTPPLLGPGQGLWRLHFLPFAVGGEVGAALLFEDLTEHRLAAEAFQAAEQRFRLLVDSASDGIAIHRAQILLYVNPEAVRLFGYQSPDELVGRPLLELVDPDLQVNFELRVREIEAGTGTGVFESAFVRRDGTSFPVECRTSRARVDEMGAGFLFFADITERRRQQRRREYAQRVDALSRMCVTIGSELQSYATALRLGLSKTKLGSTQSIEELLGVAESMSQRAIEFLQVREPDTDTSASTTIEELMGRVCSTMPIRQRASAIASVLDGTGDSDLVVDLEPAPYAVRGNPRVIEQNLSILACTALRTRIGDGPLRIRGARSSLTDDEARPSYRLSIGSRSTVSEHSSSFGSWEQGRDLELLAAIAGLQSQGCWVDVLTGNTGGLGFEIELSLDPTNAMGSELEVSAEGPQRAGLDETSAVTPPESEDFLPDTERSQRASTAPMPRSGPVLICDDEPRLVALTAGLLREFGFEVVTVRSGREAVEAVVLHPVDVVILDVNLPGEDALEIVSELRKRSNVSVILSSGYTEEDIDPSLLHHPAVKAFLAKPYGVETLVDTINEVRSKTGAHGVRA